jgi:hypothetical protein
MNVLVGCERSGVIRDAFLRFGHRAWSCDLESDLSGTNPGRHMQCDVFHALAAFNWDLAILHPPCTYLTCSAEWAYKDGPHHMKLRPGTLTGEARRVARQQAVQFFIDLSNAPGLPLRVAIENPIGVMGRYYRKPEQIIQPYQFGDDASKATCLWLQELPPLQLRPENEWAEPRIVTTVAGRKVKRWSNQTDSGQNRLSPSDDRAHLRAVTYPGIAMAMASQWGRL